MKKVLFLGIVSFLFITAISNAAVVVNWGPGGEIWQRVNSPTDLQVVAGNLEVIQTVPVPPEPSVPAGLAQLGGLNSVINTSYFELTVDLDNGPQSACMVADYIAQGAQIIVDFSGGQIVTIDIPGGMVPHTVALPTTGVHKIDFNLGGDNLIDIELNDVFLWGASTGLEMDTMQNVYAGAMTPGKGVFTSFAIPEPATLALLGLGGLLLRKRK